MLSTMPTDLLRLILAACAATDLPSLAATCHLIEETTSRRRSLLKKLKAKPFKVANIHTTQTLTLRRGRKFDTIEQMYKATLGDSGLTAFADAVRSGALAQLKELEISENRIGVVGISALADAVSMGALPALKGLNLESNNIGDAGMSALADAVRSGALAQLEELNLSNNYRTALPNNSIADGNDNADFASFAEAERKDILAVGIEDEGYITMEIKRRWKQVSTSPAKAKGKETKKAPSGISALADAVSKGALSALKGLNLSVNFIGDAGISALVDSVSKGALPALEALDLSVNSIGDAGISAFAGACASGALPALKELYLDINSISDVGMTAFAEAVRKGALASLQILALNNNSIDDDAGLTAFADAVRSGALSALKTIFVHHEHLEHPQLVAACQPRGIEIAA